jgi:hypothetical protein
MTSSSQDRNFLNDVIGTGLLESAIEWIKSNLEPEDVFSEETLDTWATLNDYEKIKEE